MSKLTSAASLLIGLAVLAGWMLRIPSLTSLMPHLVPMRVNTAAGFVLLSIALWARVAGSSFLDHTATPAWVRIFFGSLTYACAGLTAIFSVMTLAEYLLHVNLHLDAMILDDLVKIRSSDSTGRVSLTSAASFAFLSLAFLLPDVDMRRGFHPADWFNVAVVGIAFVTLVGYIYDAQSLYNIELFGPVALPTAIGFLLLSAGYWCAEPTRGLMAQVTADDPGGALIRRLLPAAVLVPLVVGWFRLMGQDAGWYGTEFGVALFTTAYTVIFSVTIGFAARSLHNTDAGRRQDEKNLRSQLDKLDLLQQITRAVGVQQDLRSIFQVVVNRLEDDMRLEFACVALLDQATETLTLHTVGIRGVALAVKMGLIEHQRIGVDLKALARCLSGQLVYQPDVVLPHSPFLQRLVSTGLRAVVAAPLMIENQAFALLISARREPHSFTSGDCEFLGQLGEHVSLASHQAQTRAALKRAYENLQSTQQVMIQQENLRVLGQLASGIAHDINNALSPASVYAQLLLEREAPLDAQTREWLSLIQRAVENASHTVTRMREFSRPHAGDVERVAVRIDQAVEGAVELTRTRWHDIPQQRGIRVDLQTRLTEHAPNILADESEVRDAVVNLILNAVDAMPEGGTLTLRTQVSAESDTMSGPQPARIVLEVSDSGVGMNEETRRRCLEPFFSTKGNRGTGLGLAMVHGMVQRSGADMQIDTEPGRGTTVRIVFPVAPAETPQAHIDEPRSPTERRLRILFVDDEPAVLKSVREMLEADGHQVVVATNGQEGIETFAAARNGSKPFTMVISDLVMPHMDGAELAAAVKAASPATPVIILTGSGHGATAAHLHADRILIKPPDLPALRQALAELASPAPNSG